ncbi:MAG: formylglycine-generating enzyme family protein, partial [Ktedonobacterales bacterium]
GLASAGWQTLNQAHLLDATSAHSTENSDAALGLAIRLARMPGAPFTSRLSVARQLVSAQRPRDGWNLLAERTGVSAEETQMAQERAALFPPPDVPARLTSLGFRGVNVAGAQAIMPPLVSVAAGPFLMGSDKARVRETYDSETPQHRVELAAFQIGKYPVTVAEYDCFLAATRHAETGGRDSGGQRAREQLDHPVANVSWQNAQAYIAWLREVTGEPGWRLPTEAEWEKAARWDARANASRVYPWGDSFDQRRCNTHESGIGHTTPVGSYPASDTQRSGASPWGAEEMAGNVWEWTSSLHKPYPYTSTDGREASDSTDKRALRGGSWDYVARYARAAYRYDSRWDVLGTSFGFRLALSRVVAGS